MKIGPHLPKLSIKCGQFRSSTLVAIL